MKKPVIYNISPARGQALLNYQGRLMPGKSVKMRLFETEVLEIVKQKKPSAPAKKQSELNADFGNLLIHGDALSACAHLKSKNIKADLVYIDPPFASGANYAKKIYLRNGQKTGFENNDNSIGEEIMYGDIWQKEDYLNWLYERLLAIREIMSETASIYLHLDWHIGAYGKILMDEIFGEENFRNEIIWVYTSPTKISKDFPKKHDTILRYSKSEDYYFNVDDIKIPYKKQNTGTSKGSEFLQKDYKLSEGGKVPEDWWDISPVGRIQEELNGYSTQKPEALLERIIKASSDEGMIVADFFAGSGTTAKVARNLGRKFIACDIGVNAVQTARDRLAKAGAEFEILKIRDGVRLFRNPAQTAEKIFSLIEGFKPRADLELGEFWDGGIADAKTGFAPVKFIGIDKRLTKESLDAILEEIYALEDARTEASRVKVIYAHKDLDVDQGYVNRAIRQAGKTTLAVDLIGLDDLLAQKREMLFAPDNADIEIKKNGAVCKVKIKNYFSPYLKTKIGEYNAKKVKSGTLDQDKAKAVKISQNGLELIEAVQFDTELKKSGVWTSNLKLEDKAGVKEKIKGVYELPVLKFKIKIRNIAGDEIILDFTN